MNVGRWVSFNLLACIAIAALAYSKKSGLMSSTFDGFFIYATALRDMADFDAFVSWNLFHGLGGLQYPFNASIVPEYLISHVVFSGQNALIAFWTLATTLIFISTYGLARVCRQGTVLSFLAGWAAAFVLMPVIWPFVNMNYTDVPFVIPGTYTLFLILTALIHLSSHRRVSIALLWTFVIIVSMLYAGIAFPQYFAPMMVGVIGPSLFTLIWARDLRKRVVIAICGLVAVLSAAVLLKNYLYGLLLYGPRLVTSPMTKSDAETASPYSSQEVVSKFFTEISDFYGRVSFPSIDLMLFEQLSALFCLIILIWAYRNGRHQLGLAAGLVFFSWLSPGIFIVLMGLANVLGLIQIDGFSLAYTRTIQMPIYLIGWAVVIAWAGKVFVHSVPRAKILRYARYFPVLVVLITFNEVGTQTHPAPQGYSLIADQPLIGAHLIEKLGIEEAPKPYQGRFANVTLKRDTDNRVHWEGQINAALLNTHKTDLRFGLSAHEVPMLTEWNNFISPNLAVFVHHLLTSGPEFSRLNKIFPEKVDVRLMRMFGVSYIISLDQLDDPDLTLVMTEVLGVPEYKHFLYQVREPNLGNLSPTDAHYLPTAVQQLDFFSDAENDVEQSFTYAHNHSSFRNLVTANNSEMWVEGEKIVVKADSDGESVIVLPIQFSNCVRIKSKIATSNPTLFMANFVLTGIKFKGQLDAELSFVFDPVRNSGCRLDDVKDVVELKVGDANTYRGRTVLK